MNQNEKDLLKENNLVDETQTIQKVQPIEETSKVNNKESAKETIETATNNSIIEQKSESVSENPLLEPVNNVLFGGYEVKNWDFSGRIYKIVGAAAAVNLLALFVIAQTNMLATSACDSPFVDRVCQVLDTVNVSRKLLKPSEYIEENYNKTAIKNEDVVWVPQDGITPPISYPEGYFAIANRDEIAAQKEQEDLLNSSGFNTTTRTPYKSSPLTPTPMPTVPRVNKSKPISPIYRPKTIRKKRRFKDNLVNTKQVLPEKNEVASKGKVKSSLYEMEDGDEKTGEDNTSTDKNTIKDSNTIAENTAKNSDSVEEVKINKEPLQDFANDVVVKWRNKEVDLNQQFMVYMKGRLNNAGTFNPDAQFTRFLAQEGDEKVINVAKSAIEAVGDSGWLGYLRNLGVKDLTIKVVQNENNLVARVESIAANESEAKTLASGLNGLFALTKLKTLGEDETILLKAARPPRAEGKKFTLDIVMPKEEAQKLINRKLTDAWAKKQKEIEESKKPKKPNGSAKTSKSDNNKAK